VRRALAFVLVTVGAAITVSACRPLGQSGGNPTAVVQRFLAAREARNLDATMDCFASEPEMRTTLGVTWVGRDAVRALMAYRLADSYAVGELQVTGNKASWTEHVRRAVSGSQPAAFDQDVEATVVDDRITSLATYNRGSRPTAQASLETSAQPIRGADLLVPAATLLLIGAMVLLWPTRPRLEVRARPQGQLLAGLREYVARRG
jgi:hypothetical protein